MLTQLMFVLLIGAALAATLVYFRRGNGGGSRALGGDPISAWRNAAPIGLESGTLHVTGVSPRPDMPGEQYVTISGSISGPSVVAHEVYGRFAWDTFQWPAVGDQIPVAYPTGKPDKWQLEHPGARPYFGSKRPKDQSS
ncbi:hypothetical protein [Nocardia seriolae]|nr:hypothetical protein [Nocardia seriolae]APB00671.1 hypothetical protein NS506_06640 [Nocardia seriolae]MTJ61839.1 hypothetical protein [Nocardia seriolae]MTJ74679.1 hypothetical protein [Nocardia seriolae]MTJ90125.1 hypothetical protein [Nocardia seriolae]MTK34089.1 hypothetical protein [Nocardia seriolae]